MRHSSQWALMAYLLCHVFSHDPWVSSGTAKTESSMCSLAVRQDTHGSCHRVYSSAIIADHQCLVRLLRENIMNRVSAHSTMSVLSDCSTNISQSFHRASQRVWIATQHDKINKPTSSLLQVGGWSGHSPGIGCNPVWFFELPWWWWWWWLLPPSKQSRGSTSSFQTSFQTLVWANACRYVYRIRLVTLESIRSRFWFEFLPSSPLQSLFLSLGLMECSSHCSRDRSRELLRIMNERRTSFSALLKRDLNNATTWWVYSCCQQTWSSTSWVKTVAKHYGNIEYFFIRQ